MCCMQSQRQEKKTNPFKKLVFSGSVEAEAAQMFAARKRIENQRKELISLLNMAYGKEGVKSTASVLRKLRHSDSVRCTPQKRPETPL